MDVDRPVERVREPTREELYEEAKRLDIPGRSKMNKDELRRAVEEWHSRS